jgi:ferredoxin
MQPEILRPRDFEIFKMATRCVDCYSCNSICPIVGEEKGIERGPNLMMQMAPYFFDPRDRHDRARFMQELAAKCLLCGTCAENCPKDLSIDEIIAAARAKVVQNKGLPFPKRFFLKTLLPSPRLLSALLKNSSLVRGLLLGKVPGESGLHLRFSLGKLDRRRGPDQRPGRRRDAGERTRRASTQSCRRSAEGGQDPPRSVQGAAQDRAPLLPGLAPGRGPRGPGLGARRLE